MFRTRPYIALASLSFLPMLGACGSSNPDADSGGTAAGKTTIGAQGGVIQLDNGFEITVPEGALTQDVDISVTELSETPPHSGFESHGPSFLLGPEGQTFAKPLTLKLPFTATDLPHGMKLDLRAFTAPKDSDAFTQLKVHEVSASLLTTSTTHFSVFTAGMITPDTVSAGEKYPVAIAADADYVYWTNSGNDHNQRQDGNEGFVMRAPRTGGPATPITTALPDPRAIALDDTHIYWVNGGDSDGGVGDLGIPGSIMRANKDGSDAVELSPAGFPVSILLNDGHLYWGDADSHAIWRMPTAGGGAQLVTDAALRPEFITADATDVYWTSGSEGTVSKAPKTGGAATELAAGQTDAKGIVLVGDNVYFADAGSNTGAGGASDIPGVIRMVPKAGGSVIDVYTSVMPTDLALVGDDLVFTDQALGMVIRLSLAGGDATVLSMDQSLPWRLFSDGSILLWSNAGKYEYDGSIQRYSL